MRGVVGFKKRGGVFFWGKKGVKKIFEGGGGGGGTENVLEMLENGILQSSVSTLIQLL